MNYHLEHHMFPLAPYHQLPKLHELVKDDCPAPYPSLWAAYREIVPAVLRQVREPGYYVRRELPPTARPVAAIPATAVHRGKGREIVDGWVEVCDAERLEKGEVLRFDHDSGTSAIYRTAEGAYHATDGICSHGKTHLADGLLRGVQIECPKHNGRFDIRDGSPVRRPACVALKTCPVKIENSRIRLKLG